MDDWQIEEELNGKKPVETQRNGRSVEDGDQLHTSQTLIIRRCLLFNRTASVNITADLQKTTAVLKA